MRTLSFEKISIERPDVDFCGFAGSGRCLLRDKSSGSSESILITLTAANKLKSELDRKSLFIRKAFPNKGFLCARKKQFLREINSKFSGLSIDRIARWEAYG